MYTNIQTQPYDRSTWERPRTTRRYFHPPKAERMFTLWAEGKIIIGENDDGSDVVDKRNGHEYHSDLESGGIWMLHGADRQAFDFRTVENIITQDGVPIHGIRHRLESVEITMESFCDTQRKSTGYIKVCVHNTGATDVSTRIGFLLRTNKEEVLVGGDVDQYCNYNPDITEWKQKFSATWYEKEGSYTDGLWVLKPIAGTSPVWDSREGVLDYFFSLKAGEHQEIIFTLNQGEPVTEDYHAQKSLMEQFWHTELARITKLPKALAQDPEMVRMVRHMVTQLLQLFIYPVGKSYVLWRQGGLRRIVWPGEANVCFEALARLGDFSDYLVPVLDTYFHVMQAPDGEIVTIGIHWACATGCALESYAYFCKYGGEAGKKCYETYRKQAYAAFQWMCTTRQSTMNEPNLAQGLFPPKRGTDWDQQFQNWAFTDNFNLTSLNALADAMKAFSSSWTAEILAEHANYLTAMKKYLSPILEKAKDSNELYIPLKPLGSDRKLVEELYPINHVGRFFLSRTVEDEDNLQKIYQWEKRTGRCDGGLYGRMIAPGNRREVWYVSIPDYLWFKVWGIVKDTEKQKEILRDQLQYAMTKEYAMIERYDEKEPYFCPWSPNGSAMGRVILMMLELSKTEEH